MIILDTNQLIENRSLQTPALTVLRAVADASGQKLAVPWLVSEEYFAHLAHDIEERCKEVERAVASLRAVLPSSELFRTDALPDPDSLVMQQMGPLTEIFEVLSTDEALLIQAIMRETRRTPPASTNWTRGGGTRDAAIWGVAMQCAMKELVYFVSRDSDFGKGDLRPELQAEVDGSGAQLILCDGIPAVLDHLATSVPLPIEERALALSEVVRQRVIESLTGPSEFFELALMFGSVPYADGYVTSAPVTLDLLETRRVTAYQIDQRVWASAAMTWRVVRELERNPLLLDATPRPWEPKQLGVVGTVQTTVLVEFSEDGVVQLAQVVGRSRFEIEDAQPRS